MQETLFQPAKTPGTCFFWKKSPRQGCTTQKSGLGCSNKLLFTRIQISKHPDIQISIFWTIFEGLPIRLGGGFSANCSEDSEAINETMPYISRKTCRPCKPQLVYDSFLLIPSRCLGQPGLCNGLQQSKAHTHTRKRNIP